MRYAEHLNRTMDRLTLNGWEQLLIAVTPGQPIPKTIHTSCPCCRGSVIVEVAVTLRPGESFHDPDDILSPSVSGDTQLELTARTRIDLLAV